MKRKNTKKKPLKVNKSFMTDYLKVLFLLSFAVICALFVSHHISLTQIKAAINADPGNTNIHLSVIQEQSIIFYKLMIGTMVCFFVAVCILTTNLTKKVSRPVENFINHIEKFPNIGQAKKIRFKKGDTFEELMKSFNFLLQRQDFQAEKVAIHNYRSALK